MNLSEINQLRNMGIVLQPMEPRF